jgi:hypothetical protein
VKKVKEEFFQLNDSYKKLLSRIDFGDTFSTTNHSNNLEDISNLIFNTSPKWIESLFKIRNKIASYIGLNINMPEDYNEDFKVGGYIKFFKIYDIEDHQIILGANDSHLNFRAIINKNNLPQYNVRVTTLVEYNNLKGKIYMIAIKPFHKLVVMRMVKNAYRFNRP